MGANLSGDGPPPADPPKISNAGSARGERSLHLSILLGRARSPITAGSNRRFPVCPSILGIFARHCFFPRIERLLANMI
jgi:hypothetical protein